MLEIALGSALIYYFATEAFEIEKSRRELFIIQRLPIHVIYHFIETILNLSP